jgi:cytochrome P450 family 142 subfamily A polypeptide 1
VPNHPTNERVRLTDGRFWASDPHEELAWLRAKAPVYWDEVGQTWGIAKYEDVLGVSRDPQTFSNAGGIRPDNPPFRHMIDLDDPEHKRRRNLVNRGFTRLRVAEREPRIREICVGLIERRRGRETFDFVMDLAAWLPLITIGDMLGVEPDAYDDLLRWSDELIRGTGTDSVEVIERAATSYEAYMDYQRRVIADRRASPPRNDLVSVLVHAEIDGERLTDEQILEESLLILIGGDETTRHVITGGMDQLFRHPAQRAALAADPALLPTAVEEMLRWVTPIKNMARTVTRDVELRGQRLAAGQKLVLLYPSANRDEDVFPEPMRFDVTRTPNDHLAFGYGAHFCLGASLARLELLVFFQELLTRLPGLRLASDAPLERRISNFITGFEAMPVTTQSSD